MRTWPRRRTSRTLPALLAAAGLVAASASTASADVVSNRLTGTVLVTTEQMPVTLGQPATTELYVLPTSDDGDPECNFDRTSESLTLRLASTNTAVATVSPSTVTFTSCEAPRTITVTPVGEGTATIRANQTSNTTDGSFDLSGVTFTAHVTALPNTAPSVEVAGITPGASYPRGAVPDVTCEVTDAEDGPSQVPVRFSPITGPYAVDLIGQRFAQCVYTDKGGLFVSDRQGYNIVDGSAPLVQRSFSPAAPVNGWSRGDVTVTYNVVENQSPSSLETTGCAPVSVTTDTRLVTSTCTATSAGGETTLTTNLRRDTVAPVVSPTSTVVSGTKGEDGWYTSDVEVSFTATDATSGLATASQTVTSEGDGEAVVVSSPVFTDRAGNPTAAGALTRTVKVDSKAPNAPTASVTPQSAVGAWTNEDVEVTFEPAGDEGPSGVAACTAAVPVTAETGEDGQTVRGTCTDHAGNVSAVTEVTVRVDTSGPTVLEAVEVEGDEGRNGWYTSDVDVTFTATDTLSGLQTSSATQSSTGEGEAVEVLSPSFTDRAGNRVEAGAVTASYRIDKSAPNAPTASLSPEPGADGWSTEDVVVTFEPAGDHGPSGLAGCTEPVTVSEETEALVVEGTCTDVAGNRSEPTQVTVKLDEAAPTVTADAPAATGSAGWYTSDVDVTFTATDEVSGPATASRRVTSSGEGAAVQVASPAFEDVAGNATAAGAVTTTLAIDKTAPAVPTFAGGLSSYLYAFGATPAPPTCTSSDATSGLASCVVTGSGSTVGVHTYTATATDRAGHTSTATRRYVVAPWITTGYASPVAMRSLNVVKAGSTLGLRFEVFAGLKELTDPAKVTMSSRAIACPSGVSTVDVSKAVTTGSTGLRYDGAAGKFVYTWKTPTGVGTCHALTMRTADGTSTTASFKLK